MLAEKRLSVTNSSGKKGQRVIIICIWMPGRQDFGTALIQLLNSTSCLDNTNDNPSNQYIIQAGVGVL